MNYFTISQPAEASFVEKKSEFIGYIAPVKTGDEAVEFVNKIKAMHRKAKHNVYAYIVRQDNISRYSDDGEPQGTAGVPVLDVLQKRGLTDVCVVVTRYFGGILLGGGGLVSSTNDYILLGAALANKGTALNGYQLLKPETVELFRTAQLDPVRKKDMMVSFPYMPGYSYALGVRTLVDDRGTPSALGHFGWDGAAGQYILVDPDNNLTFVYSQHVRNSFATGHIVQNQLRDLVYLALRGDLALLNEEAKA